MTSIVEVIENSHRISYERKHGAPGLQTLHLVFLDGNQLLLTADYDKAAEFFRWLIEKARRSGLAT